MILRIKSESGTLTCEFTEELKPAFYNSNGEFPNKDLMNNQMFGEWNNSFQPINKISEEAREYLIEQRAVVTQMIYKDVVELSGKDTECFEVIKDLHNSLRYTYELQMKEQSITPQPTETKSAEQILADKLGYDNCATDLKEKIVSVMETYASQFKNQPTDDFEKKINIAIDYWKTFDGEKQQGIVYGLGLALSHYK